MALVGVFALLAVAGVALAAFPGANGKIAFESKRDGNDEIYSMNPDGSSQSRLTNNSETDINPIVSPDGTRIVFDSKRNGNEEIFVMNADGTGVTRITNNDFVDQEPAWSRDGTRIAFASKRNNDNSVEIYTMNANGTNQTRLTNNGVDDNDPVWSPTDDRIAYEKASGGGDIYTITATPGSAETRLTTNSNEDLNPSWSPNGQRIAFDSKRTGGGDIYTRSSTPGGTETRLTTNGQPDIQPAYSPDGTKIAFESKRDGDEEIFTMNTNGSSQTQITNNTIEDRDPDWGPTANRPPNAQNDSATTNEDNTVIINVRANDSDPDGDPLTITSNTQPSNGTANCSATNCTYNPNANFNGSDSFTYTVSDGRGGTSTATVSVTVTPVNDPPVATNDSKTTDEDTNLTFPASDLTANDSPGPANESGQTLSVTAVSNAQNGTVSLQNGQVTFRPNPDYNGPASFDYTVCDSGNPQQCDTGTVNVTVNAVNDPPRTNNDSATVNEDGTTVVNVLANDAPGPANESGQTLTVTNVTDPPNGTAQITADNQVRYTPDPDYNGPDSFTYTACDNGSPQRCSDATVNVTVTAQNDPPQARDDSANVREAGDPMQIDVLDNDTSAPDEGETLTITSNTQPPEGEGTVECSDTECTFTPDEDFNGTTSFNYTISDGNGGTDTAEVTVDVAPTNDPPVAEDDTETTGEDTLTTIDVVANDSPGPQNESGQTLIVTEVTDPPNGTAEIVTDGESAGQVRYTPDENFNGTDTFDYTVCDDGQPERCDTATVTVNVAAVNDAPVAQNDSYETPEGQQLAVNNPDNGVLANDSDPDDDPLSAEPPAGTGPDADGPATYDTNQGGTVTLNDDGTFTYDPPDEDFNGQDTFDYRACDDQGACDPATVTIDVTPVNDPPRAGDDTATTQEDEPVTVPVKDNDEAGPANEDGQSLTVTRITTDPEDGTATINDNGTITYEPNANFNGEDTFDYEVCDDGQPQECDTATVTITVEAVNDAPKARNDSATTDEDTPVNIDVLNNDSDPDNDPLTITSNTQPSNGTVTCTATACTYTPNENFNGGDSFTYTISDGNDATDTATVTVTVTAANDDPVARNEAYETNEDTTLTVEAPGVLENDTDVDGDSLTAAVVTEPQNGTLDLDPDGSFTYTPNENFNGEDTFQYEARDVNGGTATAAVTITVTAQNDSPVANTDTATTDEDSPVKTDVVENDTDPDGDNLTVLSASDPENGTATINDDNTITYTPRENFNGADSFTYRIGDGNGGFDRATVNVTVRPVNDAPVAQNDAYNTDEDQQLTVGAPGVLENDTDNEGDDLSAKLVEGPQSGTLNLDPDGSFVYDPDPNFNGTDSFTYRACDTSGDCSGPTTVQIGVGPGNDPPEARNDAYETDEDATLTVDPPGVLDNDTDPDGDNLTAQEVVEGPRNGTLNLDPDGSFTYTPDENFNGTDSFTYRVDDSNGGTDTAKVTITINPVNDDPVARDDEGQTNQGTSTNINVVANDGDPDGDSLVITRFSQGENGTVTCNTNDGVCTYTPNDGFTGEDSFTYTISDGQGGSDTVSAAAADEARVTITVKPVQATNQPPEARDDAAKTRENRPVKVAVLRNDSDPDRDSLKVTGAGKPRHGKVTRSSGTLAYKPDRGFSGRDSFTYTISDGKGGEDTARVRIIVRPSPVSSPTPVPFEVRACAGLEGAKGAVGSTKAGQLRRGTYKGKIIRAQRGASNVRGTRGPDVIFVPGGAYNVFGGGGNDLILYNGSGATNVRGGTGNDLLCVFSGAVNANGGRGNDVLHDRKGASNPKPGTGRDKVFGVGSGNFSVRDGQGGDLLVHRGGGAFNCIFDPGDQTRGCKR